MISCASCGSVAERLNAPVLKAGEFWEKHLFSKGFLLQSPQLAEIVSATLKIQGVWVSGLNQQS